MIDLSIVIPAYNYGAYLKRAVASLIPQVSDAVEIIIINDGSTDNTDEVGLQLTQEYPQYVHYISQKNKGLSAVRNRGAALARGEYLIFLDADDNLLPHALSTILNAIKVKPHVDYFIARHQTTFTDGTIKPSKKIQLTACLEERFTDYLFAKKISIANGALIIKKTVFKRLQYPTHICQAEDICFNAHLLVHFFGEVLDPIILNVNRHENSMRKNASNYSKYVRLIVDEIFNDKLPDSLQKYKQKYMANRLLSLFRVLSLNGHQKAARKLFYQLVREDFSRLFKWTYLKKFIKSFFLPDTPIA